MKTFNKISVISGIGLGLAGLGIIAIANRKWTKTSRSAFSNYFGGSFPLSGYPRGVRNNNPGNIILTSSLWKGEIPKEENTDGRFKQFYQYTSGIRATIINLQSYYKKGYRTIRQIISRWAPPSENNTENYITYVANRCGISPEIPISFNKATVQKIVEAIIIKENGKLYMDQGQFDKAWAAV
jgi:hypothetical protein